jgi:hypothetical protein
MDKTEASQVLRVQLEPWRRRTYAELTREVGHSHRFELNGPSGTWYRGHIRMYWDDKPDGAVRVIGSIDDGGWRAFVPLTDSFILGSDGTFVGE